MKVTKTGYKKDSPDKKEDAVIIPSNQISMKDTEYEEIFAVPFKDGKPMKMVLMKRGGEYNFEGADYVMEIPKLQVGVGNLQYGNTFSIPNVFTGTNQFQNSMYQGSIQNTYQQNSGVRPDPDGGSYFNLLGGNGVRPDPDGGSYFNLPGGNGVTEEAEVETNSNNPNTFNQNSFRNLLEQSKEKDWSVSGTIGDTDTDTDVDVDDNTNRYNAESSKKEGVYNPYSSYDTRAAANILGRVIGGDGNKATGAAAGLKIGTSLLRDVMSGVGTAKRNKQQEEKDNENQRRGLTGNYQQEGGTIRNIEEVENVTGIRFSEDYANEYFTREFPTQDILPPPAKLDLGKYEGRGFFEIQDNGTEVRVSPTQKNYLTKDDYERSLDYLREKNPGINFSRNSYIPKKERGTEEVASLQEGGEIKLEESLTGEYIQGMPEGKENQGVVEVEQGEHIVQPDGDISEVRGDKHSQGGEKLSAEQVQEGSIVISDYTPIGGENAKYFKDKFDIKVKAKDTYATVVDKVKSKIGIDKIVKEQEEVFKKIEKQEKETENEATKNLNLQFLSGKVKELEEKKAALEPQRMEAMKEIFQRQEASKPIEERAQVDPQMMATLSQESGMEPQQAQQVIEQFLRGGTYFDLKKYQEGTGSVTYSKENAEKIKQFSEGAFANKFTSYNDVIYNEDGTVTITRKDPDTPLDAYYTTAWENLGVTPIETKAEEVNPQMSLEEMAEVVKHSQNLDPNLRGKGRTTLDGKPPSTTTATTEGKEVVKTEEEDDKYNSPFIGGRPDQGVLPPSSVNLPLKAETRLQRADGINISPEAALVENQRQANSLMRYASTLPPGQQAAFMNQVQQQAQQGSNQAINVAASQTAQANLPIDMFNIGQADKENVAASQNALSYEDRTFKTQAAYEENLLQYYDFLRNVNTQNYNDIKNENTVNSMFENYEIDSQGNLVVKTNNGQTFTIPKTAGIVAPDKATKKKQTKKTSTR